MQPDLVARIERLEKSNRRIKFAAVAFAIIAMTAATKVTNFDTIQARQVFVSERIIVGDPKYDEHDRNRVCISVGDPLIEGPKRGAFVTAHDDDGALITLSASGGKSGLSAMYTENKKLKILYPQWRNKLDE